MKIIELPFKVYRKIRHLYYILREYASKTISYLYLISKGVETQFGYVKLMGLPIIAKTANSRIILKRGVTLISSSKYNRAGINHPVILATLAENAIIEIGLGSGMSGTSICAVEKIIIGDYCALGANTKIYDTDFHPMDAALRRKPGNIKDASSGPVILENDVWLSEGVAVLKGVTIGEGSVVALGSVVTKSIPARQVFGGIPARKLKNIQD